MNKTEILKLINDHWRFDDDQQHTHTYHDKLDCLNKLELLLSSEQQENKLLSSKEGASQQEQGWISVKDRPLYQINELGHWVCTKDGEGEFIACIPYNDSKKPNQQLYWIHHCIVIDEDGLCIVVDGDHEKAGWELQHITHWMPLPIPPSQQTTKSSADNKTE